MPFPFWLPRFWDRFEMVYLLAQSNFADSMSYSTSLPDTLPLVCYFLSPWWNLCFYVLEAFCHSSNPHCLPERRRVNTAYMRFFDLHLLTAVLWYLFIKKKLSVCLCEKASCRRWSAVDKTSKSGMSSNFAGVWLSLDLLLCWWLLLIWSLVRQHKKDSQSHIASLEIRLKVLHF